MHITGSTLIHNDELVIVLPLPQLSHPPFSTSTGTPSSPLPHVVSLQVPACLVASDAVLLLLLVVDGNVLATTLHSSSSSSSSQSVRLLPALNDGVVVIEVMQMTIDDAGVT